MSVDNVLLGMPLVLAFDYRALDTKGAIIAYLENLRYQDIFQEFKIKDELAVRIKRLTEEAGKKNQSGYEQFSKYVLGPKEEPPDRKIMLERIIEFAGSKIKVDNLMRDRYVFYDMGTYLPVEEDRMDAIDAAKLAIKFAGDFPAILSCMNGQVMNATAAKLGYIPILGYDKQQAIDGRDHNDSKVLAIPGYIKYIPNETMIGGKTTTGIIDAFLTTPI